ncbi:DUF1992 domain-containing protein [Haematomicrobium sanguinis]|uniref:DnaJ family domain-containing protein n=1 Tax=Haematomicrobium sanguinis TaxID=479106 RepID=UPI00047AC626|nr:DUF1992 domain-containing protein [Haematomicrobium sanguinis]
MSPHSAPDRDPLLAARRYQAEQSAEAGGENIPEGAQGRINPTTDIAKLANTSIDQAIARGAFDNLAYSGKPLPKNVTSNDPDWWVKGLMEREQITGTGPAALQLRVEDKNLPTTLDALGSETQVREHLDDFNARVKEAKLQLMGGPPVLTDPKDIDAEVQAWKERRRVPASQPSPPLAQPKARKKNWWQRRRTS